MSVLPENWHTRYLEDAYFYFAISFLNFQPLIHFWANLGWKIQSRPFFSKICTQSISRMLILISTLVFWISNPNSTFEWIWGKRFKVVCFAWKLTHRVSWGYDCNYTEEGLEGNTKMKNCTKCWLVLYFYRS